MSKEKKIEILTGLRLILKITNLYNKNGLYIKYNKNGDSVKIPNFVVFCLIFLQSFYMLTLLIWGVIEKKFDLELISISLAVAIGLIYTAISYISLALKTDSIISTVDHLQEVVEKSK